MKTYKIQITETLQRVIDIEANSLQDAMSIINMQYTNEDIVLDYDDFVGYDIDFKVDFLKTESLVQLLKDNPSKIIEANINFNNLNATHFIEFIDGNIIHKGIDGKEFIWQIDEFINAYPSTYWYIDYVLNEINI